MTPYLLGGIFGNAMCKLQIFFKNVEGTVHYYVALLNAARVGFRRAA